MDKRKTCSEASGIFQDTEKRNRFAMTKPGEREGRLSEEKSRDSLVTKKASQRGGVLAHGRS